MDSFYFIKFTFIILLLVVCTLNYFERFDKPAYFSFYIVETDSMSPSIPVGSIAFGLPVEFSNIKDGDIITFKYPLNLSRNITHRVISVNSDDGIYLHTKGDKNSIPDPWQVKADIVRSKIVFHLPFVGLFIMWLRNPVGLICFVILPLAWILYNEAFAAADDFKNTCLLIKRWIMRKYGSKVLSLNRVLKRY